MNTGAHASEKDVRNSRRPSGVGVSFAAFIERVRIQIESRGVGILTSEFAMSADRMRMSGAFLLREPIPRCVIGISSSYDQSTGMSFYGGTLNPRGWRSLLFKMNPIVSFRNRSGLTLKELDADVFLGVGVALGQASELGRWFDGLAAQPVDDALAVRIAGAALDLGVVGKSDFHLLFDHFVRAPEGRSVQTFVDRAAGFIRPLSMFSIMSRVPKIVRFAAFGIPALDAEGWPARPDPDELRRRMTRAILSPQKGPK